MSVDATSFVCGEVVGGSNGDVYQFRHELLVDVDGQRLGEEIRKYVGPRKPVNFEVALADAITNPVVTKIDAFGLANLDAIVGETLGSVVFLKIKNQ